MQKVYLLAENQYLTSFHLFLSCQQLMDIIQKTRSTCMHHHGSSFFLVAELTFSGHFQSNCA
jgi:hypothetical protein